MPLWTLRGGGGLRQISRAELEREIVINRKDDGRGR
jgi:hypothetical protein